jgi:hypothetical protein
MVKAVLTTKIDPTYDDLPEERYHFPRTYLRQIEAAVGDWILYYEPPRPSGDAVRNLPDREYDLVLQTGFAHVMGREERVRPSPDVAEAPLTAMGLDEPGGAPFEPEFAVRDMVTMISQRPFRDRAFAVAIKSAYRDTCAVTGLKLINGSGAVGGASSAHSPRRPSRT